MADLNLIFKAISYIEENLDGDIKTEDIAKFCNASKSSLEKAFRISHQFSVHDYVVRRRMMKAARMMIKKPEMSLLDVAVQYGYSSHEAFTRSFYNVWNCNPSEFREKYGTKGQVPELFPMVTGLYQEDGEQYMRRALDISEMYDFIRERRNCYYVCADVVRLIPINEISHKAGDIALSTAMKRMMDASGDDDVVFRIGPDEFALITCSEDISYAEGIRSRILAENGQPFTFGDREIPLNLYTVITKPDPADFKFTDIFSNLTDALCREKERVDGE